MIEDAAHVDPFVALAPHVGSCGSYVVYCPRKFYVVHDGAFRESGDVAASRQLPRAHFDLREEMRSFAALGRRSETRTFLAPNTSSEPAVNAYAAPRFTAKDPRRATLVSRVVFGWVRLRSATAKERALAIYAALDGVVREMDSIESFHDVWPRAARPYVYAAVLRDPEKYAALRAAGLNVRRRDQLVARPSAWVEEMSLRLVQIPCSHSTSTRELDRMLRILRSVLG